MRLGLYGGCFNPVHQGHLAAARGAATALQLDKVIFIPSGNPPLKGPVGLAPGAHRLAMLELALAGEPAMQACAIEIDRQGPSYTVDTVSALRASFPAGTEFIFLLGDDCADRLPRWKGIDHLHAMLRFAILPRLGRTRHLADDRLIWLDFARTEISSTQVRGLLAEGSSPSEALVSPQVMEYITRHELYSAAVDACVD
jgi:nicotinate-nucleotide adenylyltransferase